MKDGLSLQNSDSSRAKRREGSDGRNGGKEQTRLTEIKGALIKGLSSAWQGRRGGEEGLQWKVNDDEDTDAVELLYLWLCAVCQRQRLIYFTGSCVHM